jgi:chromosome segregation ATPase
MDHTAWLQVITGILASLTTAILAIWGSPKMRLAIEKLRIQAATKHDASTDRLIASWERRAETLETRQALLDAANQELRSRIVELERQVSKAGNVHVADLATIANLREELDQYVARCEAHELDLAERDRKIADLEARVAELEAALSGCPVGPSCKKKAVSAKKKGGKPSAR